MMNNAFIVRFMYMEHSGFCSFTHLYVYSQMWCTEFVKVCTLQDICDFWYKGLKKWVFYESANIQVKWSRQVDHFLAWKSSSVNVTL